MGFIQKKPKRGWFKHPREHGLAAQGIETKLASAWLQDAPFTKEQVDSFNRYSFFDADINREFKEHIEQKEAGVKAKLEEYGVTETEAIKTALYYYRKAVYEYYLERARSRAIAPPISVVGPSNYQGKPQKALKIDEKASAKIEKAKWYLDKAINEAKQGKLPVSEIDKWLPLVRQAKNRLEFGKLYAEKIKEEARAEKELTHFDQQVSSGFWDHVYRGRGRILYDKLRSSL